MTPTNERHMDTTPKRRRLWVAAAAGRRLRGRRAGARWPRATGLAAAPRPLDRPRRRQGRGTPARRARPTRRRCPSRSRSRVEGENMEVVANVPIDFGADIELARRLRLREHLRRLRRRPDAAVGTPFPGNCTPGTGGVTVIDISDPENPERVGLFDCAGGQNDVQLSPGRQVGGDGDRDAATTRAIRARRAASSCRWPIRRTRSRSRSCRSSTTGRELRGLAQPHDRLAVPLHRPVRRRVQPDRHLRSDRSGQPGEARPGVAVRAAGTRRSARRRRTT